MEKLITIKNYRNISTLDLRIKNNKLNFIFGISGSGKSSIAKYLSGNFEESDKPFYLDTSDCSWVKEFDNVKIFNEHSIQELIFKPNSQTGYDLFYGGDSEIEANQKELEEAIELIRPSVYMINKYINEVEECFNLCGIKINKNGNAHGKLSSIEKWSSSNNKDVVISDTKLYDWTQKGIELIDDSYLCPFCRKEMTYEEREEISNKVNIDIGSYKKLVTSIPLQERIGLPTLDFTSEESITNYKHVALEIYEYKQYLQKVVSVVQVNDDKAIIYRKKEIEEIKSYFDNVVHRIDINGNIIGDVFDKKLQLGIKTNAIKSKINKAIQKNFDQINQYLKDLNISYQFSKIKLNTNTKELDYELLNLNASKIKEQVHLSTGEKNIISLLLSIMTSDVDLFIIDDPVSSFDEFRRSVVLRIIYNTLKGKTTIMLSHDQIFLHFLYREYMLNTEKKEFIGQCYYFENFTVPNMIEIIEGDFENISKFIVSNISKDKSYYQNILNLKHLYELKCECEEIYSYLSTIYHSNYFQNTKYTISINQYEDNKLYINGEESKFNEEKIIEEIFKKTNYRLPRLEKIVPISESEINKLPYYERFLFERDSNACEASKKHIYNSIAHFNHSYVHALNPYKFNYFSCPV